MRIEQKMPPFEGVSAGNTALIKLPIGRRFHSLFIEYSGVTLAQMTEIRVMANGKVFQRYSATERDKMNQHIGMAAAAGILEIPFDRKGLKNRDQEELTAVNTRVGDSAGNAINSFTVEIDISGAAVAPALSMNATQSEAVAGGPGLMLNIRKDTRSPAGAGKFEIADFIYNTPTSQTLNRVYFVPSTGSISEVQIERDLYNIFQRKTALNEKVQVDGGAGRALVSGWWIVDTTEHGYGANNIGLGGVQDFRYTLDVSGAMTITAISEYIGVLGQ